MLVDAGGQGFFHPVLPEPASMIVQAGLTCFCALTELGLESTIAP